MLRGEPVSAKVKKVIGGQRWWHKLFRIERHFGLLIELTKGPIDWTAHSKHRDIAEKVDELVKAALEFEKSSESVAASIEMYQKAMAAVIQLNSSNPVAAAHRYAQAPINRLTMLLVKEKKFSYAIEAYDQWRAVIDPVGITRTDSKALTKRIAKAKEKSET